MNLKKLSFSIVITILIKFAAIATGLYTAKWTVTYIPSADLANFNTILGYCTSIVTVINFGLPSIIQRFYTTENEPEKDGDFWTTFSILRILTYPIGLILTLVLLPITGVYNPTLAFLMYTMLFILVADLNFRSITDAKGNSWQFSISDFAGKAFIIATLVWFNITQPQYSSLYVLIVGSIMAYILGVVIDALWQKKYYSIGKFDWKIVKENQKSITYFFFINCLIALYASTDKIFLKRYGFDDAIINGYANAYKLFELSVVVIGLTTPMLASFAKKRIDSPSLSNTEIKFKKVFQNLFKKIRDKQVIFYTYFTLNTIIALCCSVLVSILGPFVLRYIDQNNLYPVAFPTLSILA
ncbi:MAG: hypothetical protein H7196_05160, partial [candidate division SR1 bacterium]|nr:hypothetical protein [candidate division SR1 bacterium]